jgi:hypothetical protein
MRCSWKKREKDTGIYVCRGEIIEIQVAIRPEIQGKRYKKDINTKEEEAEKMFIIFSVKVGRRKDFPIGEDF